MTDYSLAWGLNSPNATVPPVWGARAILSRSDVRVQRTHKGRKFWETKCVRTIDIVWDRCSWDPSYDTLQRERKAIVAWLDPLLKRIRKLAEKNSGEIPRSDEDREVVFHDPKGRGHVRINPRGSCGYLYISAYVT